MVAHRLRLRAARHLDAKEKMRRDQHGSQCEADRIVKRIPTLLRPAEKPEQSIDLRRFHGPPKRARREIRDALPRIARMRRHVRLRQQFRRRRQILFHQHRRNEKRRRIVIEPAAAAAIRRECIRRARLVAEQIAHGVVVFQPAQPVRKCAPRIARHRFGIGIVQGPIQPLDHPFALFLAGLRLVLRRHRAVAQFRERLVPRFHIAINRRDIRALVQPHAALLLLRAVALEAIRLQHRPHIFLKIRLRKGTRRERGGEDESANEHALK